MLWEHKPQASVCTVFSCYPKLSRVFLLTIRLLARVFYGQIVTEAQPSFLSFVKNEGE